MFSYNIIYFVNNNVYNPFRIHVQSHTRPMFKGHSSTIRTPLLRSNVINDNSPNSRKRANFTPRTNFDFILILYIGHYIEIQDSAGVVQEFKK